MSNAVVSNSMFDLLHSYSGFYVREHLLPSNSKNTFKAMTSLRHFPSVKITLPVHTRVTVSTLTLYPLIL